MKKMISARNSVIIILCITIICMGIGFIVLSMELEKKKNEKALFDMSFVSYAKVSSTKGGTVNPTGKLEIIDSGKVLDMSFTLNTAHDELIYNVVIKNNGTMTAEIVDLIASPDYISKGFNSLIEPVTITTNDLRGRELSPGEEVELKIALYYNPSTMKGKRTIDFRLGLITRAIES